MTAVVSAGHSEGRVQFHLNGLYTSPHLRRMQKGKLYLTLDTVFPFVLALIHRVPGVKNTSVMKKAYSMQPKLLLRVKKDG